MSKRFWFLIVLLLALPASASAHAVLINSSLANGAILDAAPPEIALQFSESIDPQGSSLQLYTESGLTIALDPPTFPAADQLLIALPATLRPDSYTLVYQILSAADGHITHGTLLFSLGTGAPPVQAAVDAPTSTSDAVALDAAIARSLQLLGAVGLVGGLVWLMLLVWPLYRAAPTSAGRLVQQTIWWIQWALLGIMLGTAWEFWQRMQALSGPTVRLDSTAVFWTLATSQWGALALIRIVGAAVLTPLVFVARRLQQLGWGLLALSAGMLLAWSASGHAATVTPPLFPIFADWLHFLVVAAWLGGVLGLAYAAWSTRKTPLPQLNLLGRLVPRFSPWALGSVIMISVTGAFRAVEHLTTWSDLWSTRYGIVLLIKVALFGLGGLFGLWHWRRVGPRLSAAVEQGDTTTGLGMVRTLLLESGALLAATIAAAILVQTPHPIRAAAVAPAPLPVATLPPAQPQTLSSTQDGLTVTLELDDIQPGTRTFTATLADASGPLTADRVRLRFESLDIPTGQQVAVLAPGAPGVYTATSGAVSVVGNWTIELQVRRLNLPDVTVAWTVEMRR